MVLVVKRDGDRTNSKLSFSVNQLKSKGVVHVAYYLEAPPICGKDLIPVTTTQLHATP